MRSETTLSSVRVRRRLSSDEPLIASLARDAFAEFTPRAVSTTLAMAERGTTLVAEQRGRAIGFAVLDFPKAAVAHLAAIAVSTEQRGRGIGGLLLGAAEALARQRGATRFELQTADGNLAALALFYRHGFRRDGRQQRYYARGQAADRLSKLL